MDKADSTKAQRIAQAARAFEQQTTGRVPKSMTVVLGEDTLVITLHGTLSPAETALAKSGEGAAQLRERLPEGISVFILPPSSLEQLEDRLRTRGSDDEEVIRKRLEIARQEILHAENYRYIVVNDQLSRAVDDLLDIVRGARLEGRRVLPEWRARFEAE